MSSGTIELAPPNEGGDDRMAEVAVVKAAELTIAAAGLLLTKEEALTDEMIQEFLDKETADHPQASEPEEKSSGPTTLHGSRALFVEGSEDYGFRGPLSLGQAMPGGIRNRVAGIEGRAFRQRWASTYAGQRTVRSFTSRVAIL